MGLSKKLGKTYYGHIPTCLPKKIETLETSVEAKRAFKQVKITDLFVEVQRLQNVFC